jgi:hypothetical protein
MFGTRQRRALLLLSASCGLLVLSGTASAACLARPLVLVRAAAGGARTAVKLPPFLRATLICGEARGPRGLDGAPGKTGADGAIGATGAVGATGAMGAMGITGYTGSTGPTGPAGATGATGNNGLPGTPGINGIDAASGYGYIYDTSAQSVPIESDVQFASNGILSTGIVHTPGTSQITFSGAGIYKVTFSISATGANQFALVVNGNVVPGGTYGSSGTNQQNIGQAVILVAASDVLTLRNHTSLTAATLDSHAGGSALPTVDASVLIERLA